ncbi:MAG: YnbE family lipoprotein [Alphaproteobacteria bacterium HGW-Alphaproteobacteria-11]|nr:MAG: YnbE family lipoprotein [Alphaproteobacteria bacterium HGW-Alphaproteobacteria-11]
MNRDQSKFARRFSVVLTAALFVAGCNPTVKIEAPDKPIEINLNVKIEQEIRIKVDRDLDQLLADNPDLF